MLGFGASGMLLLCSALSAQAPEILWSKTYGGDGWDICRCMQQTEDGGFVIGGTYHHASSDDYDFYVVKTDPLGNMIWESIFGDSLRNGVFAIDQTNDGGFIIGGVSGFYGGGGGTAKAILIRLNDSGDSLWAKTFAFAPYYSDVCAVQQTTDGGFFAAGSALELLGFDWQTVIIKFDANGDSSWTKIYHSNNMNICCYGAQQTYDGGYVLAGWIAELVDSSWCDYFLLKTDENGDSLWLRTYGFPREWDDAYAVQQTADSGYVLVGTSHPEGLEMGDVYVVKTDMVGDTVWTLWLVQDGDDYSYDIDQTSDGGYIIANAYWNRDFQAIRLNTQGDTVWTLVWEGRDDDKPYGVCECLDGGFALAGYTSAYPDYMANACIVKIGTAVEALLDVLPLSFCHTIGANDTIDDELMLINEGEGFLFWDISKAHESNWIMLDSVMNWVNPHDTLIVPITFSSSGISQGMHADTLLISSNDSLNPLMQIPVELRIYPRGEIVAFPNPAFASFNVDILTFINLPSQGGRVEIFDLSGRLVWMHTFPSDPGVSYPFVISLNDGNRLQQGVYFYHVLDGSGSIVKKGKFSVVR